MSHGLDHISQIIAEQKEALVGLSRAIHHHPELGDQEFTVQILCDYLKSKGFTVERPPDKRLHLCHL